MFRKKIIVPFLFLLIILGGIAFWLLKLKKSEPKYAVSHLIEADSTDELWYKNSVIYNLDIEVFKDSDGDGIGDINGLISKLNYIKSLGADVIWLAPFQPTPNNDDGYDVTDYYEIDNRLGTMSDFDKLIAEAGKHNIKIITDLVVNHTSIQHPWFQEARKDSTSPYRKWYIWSKEQPDNYDKGMVFPGVQEETWTYDSVAKAYYFHRFYKFQPGLNMHHKPVQTEIKNIITFWLNKGIYGFRLDAVPFIIEKPEKEGKKFDHNFAILTDIRNYVDSLNKKAVILGEANVEPEKNAQYFGTKEKRMHMMFNFYVNQHMFYALATEEAKPLIMAMRESKKVPRTAEWGQFLRNHDEVDLGRLTNTERKTVYEAFGPEENMQLYDRGIRRRLAPMLGNNRKHLELAYSLLLSLPSAPVLRYGDEIGMGDDLSLKERLSVRTPMQWSDKNNAGFTVNDTAVRPVIDSGVFSYKKINVADQLADSGSFLNWTKAMIAIRKKHPEIYFGKYELIDTHSDEIIGIHYKRDSLELITLHNLNKSIQDFKLDKELIENKTLTEVWQDDGSGDWDTKLAGYGYKWIQLQ